MSKMWRVLWYEYKHHVFRKRFFVALLSVPLLIVVIAAVRLMLSSPTITRRPSIELEPDTWPAESKPCTK